jgi:mgtE-like transporter
LMIPAALALRGNIFGAVGSRLGTAIHAGIFRLSLRPGTAVGENVAASMALSLFTSLILAVLAYVFAVGFGITDAIPLEDFIVISILGGILASVVILVGALLLTAGAVRFGWDPDNVTSPLVTALGDLVTVPALLIVAAFVDDGSGVQVLAIALAAFSVAAMIVGWRAGRPSLRRILNESIPILVLAILLDLLAGVAVERQRSDFATWPALLVMLPGFLSAAGALGGILSSRLASKLHLGLIGPSGVPGRAARGDLAATFLLALPVYAMTAVVAQVASQALDLASPGMADMLAVALVGGLAVTLILMFVAYYGTIAAVRFGVDPDTYGIPLVTSSLDLIGAFALVLVIHALGVA